MQTRIRVALALALAAAGCGGETPAPQPPPTVVPAPMAIETPPIATAEPSTSPPEVARPPLSELQLASLKTAADALNHHDARRYASIFTRDAFHREAAAADVVSRDDIAGRMELLFASFPDFAFSFDRVWQKGNVAVALWRWTGTDRGGFMAHKASNRAAGIQGVSVGFYNDDGQLREVHLYEDGQTVVEQLDAKAKAGTFRAPPLGAPAMEVTSSAGTGGGSGGAVLEEQNALDVAKKFYDAVEAKNEARVLALVGDDATGDDYAVSPKTFKGTTEWKALYKSWTASYGTFTNLPLLNQIAVKDVVITERILKGTERGLPVSLHAVDIAQIKDGKIAHFWTWSNRLELIQQRGKRSR